MNVIEHHCGQCESQMPWLTDLGGVNVYRCYPCRRELSRTAAPATPNLGSFTVPSNPITDVDAWRARLMEDKIWQK